MRKSSRRRTLALTSAASVAALLALAGCSSGSGGSGSSAPAAGQPLSLTIEDYYVGTMAGNYNKIYKACAAAHGDTITSAHAQRPG